MPLPISAPRFRPSVGIWGPTSCGTTHNSAFHIGPDLGSTSTAPTTPAHIGSDKWSGATTDQASAEDYPEIGGSTCWDLVAEARQINMVGPRRTDSHNSFSKYPTIRESIVSDTQTPSNRVVRNLNPDFSAVRLQTIIESIQHLAPQDSPLVARPSKGLRL
jgi:hypothetical protein